MGNRGPTPLCKVVCRRHRAPVMPHPLTHHGAKSAPNVMQHSAPATSEEPSSPGFFDSVRNGLQLAFSGSTDNVTSPKEPPVATLLLTIVEARNLALDNHHDKLEIVSRKERRTVRMLAAHSERHYVLHPYVIVKLNTRPLHSVALTSRLSSPQVAVRLCLQGVPHPYREPHPKPRLERDGRDPHLPLRRGLPCCGDMPRCRHLHEGRRPREQAARAPHAAVARAHQRP